MLNIWLSFLAGLFAPLGAICVLPLYPGYLAYLAKQDKRKNLLLYGLMVAIGIMTSMAIIGLIFIKFLQASLTEVIGIVSPIAFVILAFISILMIFNIGFGKFIPNIKSPITKKPLLSAFLFGLFFGIIVLPCNPGSLVILFALSTSITSALSNFIGFLAFGFGMALPLFALSFIAMEKSGKVLGFLTGNNSKIIRIAGVIMLIISLYYLIFVF